MVWRGPPSSHSCEEDAGQTWEGRRDKPSSAPETKLKGTISPTGKRPCILWLRNLGRLEEFQTCQDDFQFGGVSVLGPWTKKLCILIICSYVHAYFLVKIVIIRDYWPSGLLGFSGYKRLFVWILCFSVSLRSVLWDLEVCLHSQIEVVCMCVTNSLLMHICSFVLIRTRIRWWATGLHGNSPCRLTYVEIYARYCRRFM